MSNNIVFQHSAGELKSAVYGYDGSQYRPIKTNSNGDLNVSIQEVDSITSGTVQVSKGTLTAVEEIDSITNGTIHVSSGTLSEIEEVGSVSSVTGGTVQVSKGTLTAVEEIDSITNGTIHVSSGTLSEIEEVGSVSSITGGTVQVSKGTLTTIEKIDSITNGTVHVSTGTVLTQGFDGISNQSIKVDTNGQLMVGLYDREFTEMSETIADISTTGTFGTVIDTSKYQDYSWYINRLSSSTGDTINVQLAVAPTPTANYALIGGMGTVIGETAQVITNEYYFHYTKLKVWTPSRTATVQVWFNGRY
ncbi:hypothetical protein D4Z93_04335 [Clostridium fermenticellae]|uniref:DUF6385 domain-containing protein n=1 Tax=Clostridium fermenticellae TaxID=2068654 RepID=A0A386H2L2_9CLOT|nr:DUF6385 domain-containing protein [Clostridium fermenticellae]AYD39785.1 hypothetical protein D4Z93_04335 [Clostridium fermenticellae]